MGKIVKDIIHANGIDIGIYMVLCQDLVQIKMRSSAC
mgnify:CR=1 FL=1